MPWGSSEPLPHPHFCDLMAESVGLDLPLPSSGLRSLRASWILGAWLPQWWQLGRVWGPGPERATNWDVPPLRQDLYSGGPRWAPRHKGPFTPWLQPACSTETDTNYNSPPQPLVGHPGGPLLPTKWATVNQQPVNSPILPLVGAAESPFLFPAAAAKSLQSCPTLCDPIDGSPPSSPVPGILQARILEWVAISSSSARKWKAKVKSLSRVWLLATPWTAAYQAPPSVGFFQARVLEWGATAFSACKYYIHLTSRNHIDLVFFYFLGISLAGYSTFFSIYTLFLLISSSLMTVNTIYVDDSAWIFPLNSRLIQPFVYPASPLEC